MQYLQVSRTYTTGPGNAFFSLQDCLLRAPSELPRKRSTQHTHKFEPSCKRDCVNHGLTSDAVTHHCLTNASKSAHAKAATTPQPMASSTQDPPRLSNGHGGREMVIEFVPNPLVAQRSKPRHDDTRQRYPGLGDRSPVPTTVPKP